MKNAPPSRMAMADNLPAEIYQRRRDNKAGASRSPGRYGGSPHPHACLSRKFPVFASPGARRAAYEPGGGPAAFPPRRDRLRRLISSNKYAPPRAARAVLSRPLRFPAKAQKDRRLLGPRPPLRVHGWRKGKRTPSQRRIPDECPLKSSADPKPNSPGLLLPSKSAFALNRGRHISELPEGASGELRHDSASGRSPYGVWG